MPPPVDHDPQELNLQNVRLAWETLGAADDGPHQFSLVLPNERGTINRRVDSWPQLRALCEQYVGQGMLCISVNPVRADMPPRKPLDADIPRVTNVFLDFDCKDGDVAGLIERTIPRVNQWCDNQGLEHFCWADSGNGLHAYAPLEPIAVSDTPDIARRIAILRGEIRRLFEGDARVKVDSTFDLSRAVKLIGTRKIDATRMSSWISTPSRVIDTGLTQWLLDLRVEQPAPNETPDVSLAQRREEIEAAIASHPELYRLSQRCIETGEDRSTNEYMLARELWLRNFRDARAVAAYRHGLSGSHSAQAGYRWALTDTERCFREQAETQGRIPASARAFIREWDFTAAAFAARDHGNIPWLIEPFISRGETVFVAAEPKTGKSYVVLDWCFNVAARDMGVEYIAGEAPPFDWAARLNLMARGRELDLASVPRFRFLHKPPGVDLANQNTLSEIRARILDRRPSLVVFDTLRALMVGNENDSEVAARIGQSLAWMSEDIPGDEQPTYLIIHHLRKKATDRRRANEGRPSERMRGSTQLWGGVDTVGCLDMTAREDGLLRTSIIMEHRYAGEDSRNIRIRFTPEQIVVRYDQVHAFPTTAVGDAMRRVMDVLADGEPRSVTQIRTTAHGRTGTISEAIAALEAQGLIRRNESDLYELNGDDE